MSLSLPPSQRPPVDRRCFTSPIIEQVIADTCPAIADPQLAWLFANCFPNTLDTTVTHVAADAAGKPDTFIITGDIDAMWLRDSTNQVWPYLRFARDCPQLRALLRGLINRHARCILLDPYANAFYRTPDRISPFKSDHTDMRPGIHERKYELDSLASVMRLATGYFEATDDRAPFDADFLVAIALILQTIKNEQAGTAERIVPHYSFARTTANATDTLGCGGHGNPCRRTGMSRSPFRPSDDAALFQYHIPANAMTSTQLRLLADLLETIQATSLAATARALSTQLTTALSRLATFTHPLHGPIFAYEVDGFGSHLLMDDANLPNLLSLPYLGFCPVADPIYQATRRFILSPANPYFHLGNAVPGGAVGGPHIGQGWVWPLGIITQAITSINDTEILACLRTLVASNAGTGFMHEGFWKDDHTKFTRPWFAWANTFFGELILHLAGHRPHLLKEPLA